MKKRIRILHITQSFSNLVLECPNATVKIDSTSAVNVPRFTDVKLQVLEYGFWIRIESNPDPRNLSHSGSESRLTNNVDWKDVVK